VIPFVARLSYFTWQVRTPSTRIKYWLHDGHGGIQGRARNTYKRGLSLYLKNAETASRPTSQPADGMITVWAHAGLPGRSLSDGLVDAQFSASSSGAPSAGMPTDKAALFYLGLRATKCRPRKPTSSINSGTRPSSSGNERKSSFLCAGSRKEGRDSVGVPEAGGNAGLMEIMALYGIKPLSHQAFGLRRRGAGAVRDTPIR
jgi:hypothetical protein